MTPYTLDRVRTQILDAVRRAVGDGVELSTTVPPPDMPADLAVPCFPLAPALRKSPAAIAADLAGVIATDGALASVRADGGYLNFSLDRGTFAAEVMDDIARLGDRYGSSDRGAGQTVVIDYSAPNIARPMSVGHLRSTVIGDAIYKLHAFGGFRPLGDNHLGDWGTQFGAYLYAFQTWVDADAYQRDPIGELLRIYVKFDAEARAQPELRDKAREWSLKLERGDPEARRLWAEFTNHSKAEFDRVYQLLDVSFDYTLGESFYEDKTQEVIDLALSSGVAVEHEGALIVPLDDVGITTPLLLRRRDGATLYSTRDLAAAIFRIREFHPTRLIYVVGAQALYFAQIFATLRKLGFSAVEYVHVDFGSITLPEGRMRTRRGTVIFLEDLLHEAMLRARKMVDEKNPELPESERAEVARIVGVGAVKYADLSQNRVKNIAFDWDRMLALDGDSAPYLQYTYVRARGILRKAGDKPSGDAYDARAADAPEAWALLKTLARFPDAVHDAAETYHPHVVANHLFHLAQQFHAFYHEVPVLQADDAALRAGRLQLVSAVAAVMRTGLGLLGIGVPERM
jgi:arginyl-tRNA synthetase